MGVCGGCGDWWVYSGTRARHSRRTQNGPPTHPPIGADQPLSAQVGSPVCEPIFLFTRPVCRPQRRSTVASTSVTYIHGSLRGEKYRQSQKHYQPHWKGEVLLESSVGLGFCVVFFWGLFQSFGSPQRGRTEGNTLKAELGMHNNLEPRWHI